MDRQDRTDATQLFTPLAIGDLQLRNRIVVSPMCQYSSADGGPSDWHLVHLGKFAMGGAAVVFCEETAVEARARKTYGCAGIYDDRHVPQYRRINDFIRGQGAVPAIQLGHSGRKAACGPPWENFRPYDADDAKVGRAPWAGLAPSAIAGRSGGLQPLALTVEGIREVIVAWREAAQRSLAAGYDILEIHGAHGYLIHQFLSQAANRRTDRYGGSAANRMRFAVEVVQAVRRHWPESKPLFLRVSGADELDWTVADSVALAAVLKEHGVDVIDCSAGGISDSAPSANPVCYGYQVKYADAIRRGAGVTTMAVGMIVHADQAEAILKSGAADLVALGREFLVNPNWAMDAALKLGIAQPYAHSPALFGHYLGRRKRSFEPLRHSTWQTGIGSQAQSE